ncbi:MAG: YARHG domain-containing protein [Eubacterium sp.]|nr:YARHG domain-containing protein [Eubacterium sp.]
MKKTMKNRIAAIGMMVMIGCMTAAVTAPGVVVSAEAVYDSTGLIFPDSSSRTLTYEEVNNYSADSLQMAINDIYARHGYIFQTNEILRHYLAYSWYVPTDNSMERVYNTLNNVEKANVELLTQVRDRKYAEQAQQNTAGMIIPDSSYRMLTYEELNKLSDADLQSAINEIYARHGYIFQSNDILRQYQNYSWYRPTNSSMESVYNTFNIVEKSNVELMNTVRNNKKTGTGMIDTTGLVFPDSSSRTLSYGEVSNLSDTALQMAINEIYARHGYIFQSDDILRYYQNYSWYVPTNSNMESVYNSFNSIEKANADLLMSVRNSR